MQIKSLIVLFDFIVIIIRDVKISFIIIINIEIDKSNFFYKAKNKAKNKSFQFDKLFRFF